MSTIDSQTPVAVVLANAEAIRLVEAAAPEFAGSPMLAHMAEFPIGPLLQLILGKEDPRIEEILVGLSAFEDATALPLAEADTAPRADYESDDVPKGEAAVTLPGSVTTGERVEVVFVGPSHGNPFVDVELTVGFHLGDDTISVGGFYDGNGVYRARFRPPVPGDWTFTTASNARSLDGISGALAVAAGAGRGPIRASGRGFTYADGSPFVPLGTTAYAWTHQAPELQEETLASLAQSPFNKLRMCLFPKSFIYNSNEPEHFVFERTTSGEWDFSRFDPVYFADLESRLDQLAAIGIEADLILFHPYDRWGFAAMGATIDDRYVSYVARRLSSFTNVWWSMANEYELLTSKRAADWARLADVIRANDPVAHPISIHNWIEPYDCSAEWISHASIQGGGCAMGESVARWRKQWDKPIVVDEFGYEGDLEPGWGNLLGEEVVRRFWEGTLRGGFLTHGETFHSDDDKVFWSKGGTLRGESIPRLAFLRELIEASPTGTIEPLPGDWDFPSGGVEDSYILTYFGASRPLFRTIHVSEGLHARIDIIDTWNMTITELPGSYDEDLKVQLPARPFMAVRVRAAND